MAVALTDRVMIIEDGRIGCDCRVDFARPREHGSPELAAMEGRVLCELFRNVGPGEEA